MFRQAKIRSGELLAGRSRRRIDTFSFDLSVEELMADLTFGVAAIPTIVGRREDENLDPEDQR